MNPLKLFSALLIITFIVAYIDICLNQLKDEKCNLFCRKELELFLARLLTLTKDDRGIKQLVEAALCCENGLILDGLSRVMLEQDLRKVIANDYSVELLNKFEQLQRAEGNICDLAGYLL